MTLTTFLRLTAATVVLTAVTSVIMLIPNWNGLQGSAEADDIDTLLDVMIVLSSLVFSVVIVMMVYAIWKYRAKPGDESDGEPIHGNTKLEVIWTTIPTLIVIFAAVYATVVLNDIEAEAADSLRVDVTAQQYAWRFDYPDTGRTSTELHAPSGTQLELHLQSLDVLHSFWVPEWRIKRDLVPGASLDDPAGDQDIDNVVRVTPDVEGTYSVICTELCGFGHSTMRAVAVVESDQQFETWLAEQKDVEGLDGQVGNGAAGGIGAGSLAEGDSGE